MSVVWIGAERFLQAPSHLRPLDAAVIDDIGALARVLRDVEIEILGEARLAYADGSTLQLSGTDGVVPIDDHDPRLASLAADADRNEWLGASADEATPHRYGCVERDELLAVASVHDWSETIASSVSSRPLTPAGAALPHAPRPRRLRTLTSALIPQWRSRLGNDASARVADRLGFIALGRQATVRLPTRCAFSAA